MAKIQPKNKNTSPLTITDMSDVGEEYLNSLNELLSSPNEVETVETTEFVEKSQISTTITPEVKEKAQKPSKVISFSALEYQILEKLTETSQSKASIAKELGLPVSAISAFANRKETQEYINDAIKARNLMIKTQIPNMLMEIMEAKLDRIKENGELTLADSTKKDVVEIAKTLADILKMQDASDKKEELTGFQLIYNQLNVMGA